MKDTPVCIMCQVPMEIGHIPDSGHGGMFRARWHPGEPDSAKFLGFIKLENTISYSFDRSLGLRVIAFRCPQCSRLELFAPPKPTNQSN